MTTTKPTHQAAIVRTSVGTPNAIAPGCEWVFMGEGVAKAVSPHRQDWLDEFRPTSPSEAGAALMMLLMLSGCQGIIWYHPDGRTAQLLAEDLTAGPNDEDDE